MGQTRSRVDLTRIFAVFVVGVFLAQIAVVLLRHANYFWDFDVYFTATSALWSGENPYAATHPDHPFRYVYPLASLIFFLPLLPFGEVVAPVVHLTFQLCVVGMLWNHWRRDYVGESKRHLFTAFFVLAFSSCLSSGLRAGNVAVFESALVWAAIAFYLRNRLVPFVTLIVISACFKIVTIVYLGLLVFSPGRLKWIAMLGGAIGYVLVAGFPSVMFPDWYGQMIENITLLGDASRGALNPSSREFCQDLSSITGVPNLYPLVIAVVSGLTAWRIFSLDDQRLRVMLYVLSLCLVLPRLKDYSYLVLVLPVFFTFDLIGHKVARVLLLAVAMVPTRYATRYLFGIPDEDVRLSFPLLCWEYVPLMLLATAWGYHIVVLCRPEASETKADSAC